MVAILEENVSFLLSLEQMVNPSGRVFKLHNPGVFSSNAGTDALVEDSLVLGTVANEDIQINITSVETEDIPETVIARHSFCTVNTSFNCILY